MTERSRRAVLRAGAALAVGGLAGCSSASGGDATPRATPTPTATPAPANVGATCSGTGGDYRFSPAIVRIEVGGTVEWSAASRCKQQVLAYHPENDAPLRIPDGADSWKSPVMKQGDSFAHTFEVPGVYNYLGLFEKFGQVGIVIVGEPTPDQSSEPGLSQPGTEIPEAARTRLRELIDDVETELG